MLGCYMSCRSSWLSSSDSKDMFGYLDMRVESI